MNTIQEIQVTYKSNQLESEAIISSTAAYKVLLDNWNKDTIELLEEVKVLYLNNASKPLGIYNLAKGGINQCTVDLRLIYSIALKVNATGLIVAHNHPSGELKPSAADQKITAEIKAAGEILNIKMLDHLIITRKSYYSFQDNM